MSLAISVCIKIKFHTQLNIIEKLGGNRQCKGTEKIRISQFSTRQLSTLPPFHYPMQKNLD